ncbi:MAG TPA: septum formation inhibitor Maf [Firmicutes bacterium]|nr:septum formation inhibitor Maf [Candidatus Fermentithermobacillaceae bacterium]
MRLILASESPRRKALLEGAGIIPVVVPSNAAETVNRDGIEPHDLVKILSRRKIDKVSKMLPDDYVLGADTIVYIDGTVLGKPESADDARRMLRKIAGKTHVVYTGVALWDPRGKRVLDDFDKTEVTMSPLTEEEIDWYVSTGEPMDKAGSYALQGIGGMFVTTVNGDFSSVIGLPLPKVYRLLRLAGVRLEELLSV